jgi:DNA-directed RNA polymerase subunit RPC12/RpoP
MNEYPRYVASYACYECKKELTERIISGNDGVCPFCGNMSDSSRISVIKTVKKIEGPAILVKAETIIDLDQYAGYGGYKPNKKKVDNFWDKVHKFLTKE